jgi:hypothetical protein
MNNYKHQQCRFKQNVLFVVRPDGGPFAGKFRGWAGPDTPDYGTENSKM